MHKTRVHVDELLAEGKIDEAEAYMEQRRQIFVQNGYYIRRLNQAYFAFYGAYADVPGGAAGEDPVGPFLGDDLFDDPGPDGLDVDDVRGLGVGLDGGRVRVHQHHLHALLA